MKGKFATTTLAAVGLMSVNVALGAERTMEGGSEWTGNNWTARDLWRGQIYANDGDVALIKNSASFAKGKPGLNMDKSGLSLGGLDLDTLVVPFYSASGYFVTMVGDRPFLAGTATTKTSVQLPIKGSGENVLRRQGAGTLVLQTPVEGFSRFEVWQGEVTAATNATANPAIAKAGTDVVLCGGTVKVAGREPGETATIPSMKVAPGVGRLDVENGATVTIGSFAREPGGVGIIHSDKGIAALGDTEKVLVAGRASDDPGTVDGSLVTMERTASPHAFEFVTYDGTAGFKAAGTGTAFASGEAVAGIADANEDTTISENTSVAALRVKNGSTVTIAEGATLSVGDGANPAGVLFQNTADSTRANVIGGKGTLAFGNREGVLWFGSSKSGAEAPRTYASLPSNITGTAGVTFAGRRLVNTEDLVAMITMPPEHVAAWSGPTHIANLRLKASHANLPDGGDVYVDGNDDTTNGGGQLWINEGASTWTQKFHLSGSGVSPGDDGATLYFAVNGVQTLTAPMTVDSTVRIFANGDKALPKLMGNISGLGGIALKSGGDAGAYIQISGTNTYAGPTSFRGTNLKIVDDATLGRGKVTSESGQVYYDGHANAVISNAFDVTSRLTFRNATAELHGLVKTGTFRLYKPATIGVSNVVASRVQSESSNEIKALYADTVLTVGEDDQDTAVSCRLSDGTGRLSLVKQGANRVQLYGQKTYTGTTLVKQGTLQLLDNLTNSEDVVYWIDAEDAAGITWDDSTKRVSKVLSKNRNGFAFRPPDGYGGPTYVAANGAEKARFSFDQRVAKAAEAARFVGNKSVQQRTVFIAGSPKYGDIGISNAGIFGAQGRDMGQRVNTQVGGWDSQWVPNNGASYTSVNGFRQNGVLNDVAAKGDGVPFVISMQHDVDRLAGQYSAYSDFTPTLCGYATWGSAVNGFLGWSGDIYEVIAFNRVLELDEIQAVENYLSEKWLGRKVNAEAKSIEELAAEKGRDILPAATDLTLFKTATLDLNGVSQTVASLDGEGAIVNSSSRPATLTVNGPVTFRGEIGAGVILLKGGSGADDLELHVAAGGGVGATDGTLSLSPYVECPVTNGIAFWMDASWNPDETIQRDENGGVTNWIARAGSVSNFYFKVGHKYCVDKPTYSATAYDGKGAVKFTAKNCALYPAKNCNLRTVFLLSKNMGGGLYMFGREANDLSFRANEASIYVHGKFNMNPVGALFHVNGQDYTDSAVSLISYTAWPALLTVCSETWQSDYANYNCAWMLGCNMNGNGVNQEMAEIICYSERLTDAQIVRVEDYLMKKWGLRAGTVAVYDKTLEDGAGIAVGGNGTFDAKGEALKLATLGGNGGTVSNYASLEVTDSFLFPVIGGEIRKLTVDGDLTIGSQAVAIVLNGETLDRSHPNQPALEVTGEVTGGTLATAEGLPRQWTWSRVGAKLWSVCKNGLLILLK